MRASRHFVVRFQSLACAILATTFWRRSFPRMSSYSPGNQRHLFCRQFRLPVARAGTAYLTACKHGIEVPSSGRPSAASAAFDDPGGSHGEGRRHASAPSAPYQFSAFVVLVAGLRWPAGCETTHVFESLLLKWHSETSEKGMIALRSATADCFWCIGDTAQLYPFANDPRLSGPDGRGAARVLRLAVVNVRKGHHGVLSSYLRYSFVQP